MHLYVKDCYIFPIERPNGLNNKSFPSAHTVGSFLGAILLGFSCYISNHHWPSDVVAGASIGMLHRVLAGSKFL